MEMVVPAHVLQKLPVKVLVAVLDMSQMHVHLPWVEQQPLDRHAKAMMEVMVITVAVAPVEGAQAGSVSLTKALVVAALVYSITSQELDYILLAEVEGVIATISTIMG